MVYKHPLKRIAAETSALSLRENYPLVREKGDRQLQLAFHGF